MDSVTGNIKLVKPEISGSPNTWGSKLNEDMDKLDDYGAINRVALQTGLQRGNSTALLPDVDGTDPVALNDISFRTATQPLFYADAVVIAEDFPHTLVSQLWVKKLIDLVFPIKTILAFGGSVAEIPAGWTLCDGIGIVNNAGVLVTPPDLRGRFILGADPRNAPTAPGQSGGTANDFAHTHPVTVAGTSLTYNQLPPHVHDTAGAPGSDQFIARKTSGGTFAISGGGPADGYGLGSVGDGSIINNGTTPYLQGLPHNHTATVDGNTEPPPFWALCYIMKIAQFGFTPP